MDLFRICAGGLHKSYFKSFPNCPANASPIKHTYTRTRARQLSSELLANVSLTLRLALERIGQRIQREWKFLDCCCCCCCSSTCESLIPKTCRGVFSRPPRVSSSILCFCCSFAKGCGVTSSPPGQDRHVRCYVQASNHNMIQF